MIFLFLFLFISFLLKMRDDYDMIKNSNMILLFFFFNLIYLHGGKNIIITCILCNVIKIYTAIQLLKKIYIAFCLYFCRKKTFLFCAEFVARKKNKVEKIMSYKIMMNCHPFCYYFFLHFLNLFILEKKKELGTYIT